MIRKKNLLHTGAENGSQTSPEKRKFSERYSPELPRKKMSFGLKSGAVTSKAHISFSSGGGSKPAPIKMALGAQKMKAEPVFLKPKKSVSVAQAFNQDDESDEEEMPFEAKMRMRNLGRETPTAAGPNSFGKGKMGFCDRRALMKKELETATAKVSGD